MRPKKLEVSNEPKYESAAADLENLVPSPKPTTPTTSKVDSNSVTRSHIGIKKLPVASTQVENLPWIDSDEQKQLSELAWIFNSGNARFGDPKFDVQVQKQSIETMEAGQKHLSLIESGTYKGIFESPDRKKAVTFLIKLITKAGKRVFPEWISWQGIREQNSGRQSLEDLKEFESEFSNEEIFSDSLSLPILKNLNGFLPDRDCREILLLRFGATGCDQGRNCTDLALRAYCRIELKRNIPIGNIGLVRLQYP